MRRTHLILFLAPLILGLSLLADSACAGRSKHLFKIASLAPQGSIWSNTFNNFVSEVKKKTGGNIKFKTYPGGVMGDDLAMYRKMKVGQLHGGGFTMTGISSFVPDFSVLGIPFLFETYEEIDYVFKKLMPYFEKKFEEKDMVLLARSEVGFIYLMSTVPVRTLADLKNSKTWIPDRDPLSKTFLETVGVSPIQLTIPDVLTSLQTGLVNTVFNSFYGSIILQWFTRTQYITNSPFSYGYGAVLVDSRTFSRLSPEHAALMRETAQKHFSKLIASTRDSNNESWAALKKNGAELVQPDPQDIRSLHVSRDKTVAALAGKAFSREAYDKVITALEEYRSQESEVRSQKSEEKR